MSISKAAMEITLAMAEVIRTQKEIPSGHLYAQVMGKMTLDQYTVIIGALKNSGLVQESNHLLRWVGRDLKES